MKKDLLKGFTMFTLVVVITLAAAAVSANAQSSDKLVVADIPFEFVVADQAMPAGEYRVKPTSLAGNGLLIQSADASHSAIRLTNAIDPKKNRTQARLVFRRYGERYFLSEVWNGTDSTGRQLTKCKEEKAIERELAAIQSKSEWAQSTYAIVEVMAKAR
jgi:hypothetical protein